jgi:ubiquinone biosynthesis protein
VARSPSSRDGALRRWSDAAQALPRFGKNAVRHGLLPVGFSAASTARREGLSDLHWKVVGDALVRFLQHCGPVFTKFGQILATRDDLLPAAVCARLEALYSQQPPMSARELERALHAAYGRRLPFQRFSGKPLAVGSIGQVHRARLGGQPVIVKVIRPGAENQIARDLNVARVLLGLVLGLPGRRHSAVRQLLNRLLEDLGHGFAREVDLEHEARSLREFGRRYADHPHVKVPDVYEEFSCGHVLVMGELRGRPLSAWRRRAKTHPEQARRVADLALTEILKQIFEDGHFHGDPHAGNLLVLDDGRLGLIDLGLTGEFSHKDRRNIARAVRAFLARDPNRVIRALLAFGTPPSDFDPTCFRRDVLCVVEQYRGRLAGRILGTSGRGETSNPLEDFVGALFGVAFAHHVYVPQSATLLIKTLVTIEGVARSLDPELNLTATALPVVLRSLTPRWLRWAFGTRARGTT